MLRRAFLGTAATLSIPLAAGCTRDGGDDGGSGDGGGGGPYGMIGTGGADMAAGDAADAGTRPVPGQSRGPALGPESDGDTEDG